MEEYKEKCLSFSENIDRWHSDISEKKTGKITKDEDYIDITGSPTRFESPEDKHDLDFSTACFNVDGEEKEETKSDSSEEGKKYTLIRPKKMKTDQPEDTKPLIHLRQVSHHSTGSAKTVLSNLRETRFGKKKRKKIIQALGKTPPLKMQFLQNSVERTSPQKQNS